MVHHSFFFVTVAAFDLLREGSRSAFATSLYPPLIGGKRHTVTAGDTIDSICDLWKANRDDRSLRMRVDLAASGRAVIGCRSPLGRVAVSLLYHLLWVKT